MKKTKMISKKTILTASLLTFFLLFAFCFSAGCIFSSEPDPIVGTYVYTEDYEPPVITNPDIEHPVGDFKHRENAIKFYENGSVLFSYSAGLLVSHYNSEWNKKDNSYYVSISNGDIHEFLLSSDKNRLILISITNPSQNIKYDENRTYFRNDSYVIPEIWP